MGTFKGQLEKDFAQTFFNLEEFAEMHRIDGKETPVVVDNGTLLELNLGTADTDGIFEEDILFFVQKEDLSPMPAIGQLMEFDGETYQVGNVLDDYGSYTILLRGNVG